MDTALNRSVYVQLRFFVPKLLKDKEFEASFTYSPYQKEINEYGPNKTQKVTLKRNVHADRDDMLAFESPKIYIHKQYNSVWEPAIKRKDRQDGRSNGAHVIIRYKNSKSTIDQVHIPWYYEYENRIYERKYKTTTATNAQNPNHQVTVQLNTQTCPHTYDGAIKVAEYIVEEIKKNIKSDTAKLIKIYNKTYAIAQASSLWAFKVRTGGDWDHKWKIEADKNLNSCTQNQENNYVGYTIFRISDRGNEDKSHYHKYKNYDYYYDVWSNIHYGYVGLSVGFSEEILLTGSAVQQRMQDRDGNTRGGDTPDDITCMKIGFELFKQFGEDAENLKAINILEALDKTPINSLKVSKKMHWCLNPKNPVMQIPHKTIRAPLCNS